jgi:hypothetical protein
MYTPGVFTKNQMNKTECMAVNTLISDPCLFQKIVRLNAVEDALLRPRGWPLTGRV